MNEENRFDIGASGIDTQYERDQINYKPSFEYEKAVIDPKGLSVDTASQLQEIAENPAVSIWDKIKGLKEASIRLEEKLSKKLANTMAIASDENINKLKEAVEVFQGSAINNVPFSLYKSSLQYISESEIDSAQNTDKEKWAAAITIRDLYEDYQAGVNGELNAELYSHVLETLQDIQELEDFYKRGIIAQVLPKEDFASIKEVDEKLLKRVHLLETESLQSYNRMMKAHKDKQRRLQKLWVVDDESDRYHQLEQEVASSIKTLDELQLRVNTRSETITLVNRKLNDVAANVGFIENSIDYHPYKDDYQEVAYHIIKQEQKRDKALDRFNKMKVLMNLSVDKKKDETSRSKGALRGLAGIVNRKKINRRLVNGIHLRTDVARDVYEFMEYFDGVPNNSTFEIVANHVVDGFQQSEKYYADQSQDFEKVHAMEFSLRRENLIGLINKDASRQIHKMMSHIVRYANDSNSWPKEKEILPWIDDLIKQQNK